MSKPGVPRTLTLTEELERLEQQITLTLQEIDSNFSKAHRIVTTSILPIVEEYAKHSNEVWEGSKFWKQFFEASANVSLSGYEEATDETATNTETTDSFPTSTDDDQDTITGAPLQPGEDDEFSVDSPTQATGVHSTPKLPPSTAKKSNRTDAAGASGGAASSYRSPSPRKYTGRNPLARETPSEDPSTPRMNIAADIPSSPFEPESGFQPSAFRQAQNHDPLMHRAILDKNYRIQATPLTQRRPPRPPHAAPMSVQATPVTTSQKALWDDSPPSSPEIAAPQLRTELFSPAATAKKAAARPRTPGVSVLTPAGRKKNGHWTTGPTTSTGMQLFSPRDKAYAAAQARNRGSHLFDGDGDEDEDEDTDDFDWGMSPPKTMQFHVPQSRLLQTPAREASRKIVDDLLLTAGADATDEIEGDADVAFDEPSPSVVRRAYDVEDDTF